MDTLQIVPYGIVRGGFLYYHIDGDRLDYSGKLTVKALFSTRVIPFSGQVVLPAGALKNSHYTPVGSVTQVGDVKLTVVDTIDYTDLEVSYPPLQLRGRVALDTSNGPDGAIIIAGVRLRMTVNGVTLNIVAAPQSLQPMLAL